MSAFDDLERELRAGVRRVHASAARDAEDATPRRQPWLRPPALALAGALLVAGGALAATGTIRIGPVHDDHDPRSRPNPHHGAGVRAGAAKTIALRVSDPAGGPPWTLRVFRSSRGASCVQVGQVVRGHFGVFVAPGTLEPLRAWPGGSSSLCSGQARAGFPVVRGLQRIRVVGGAEDPTRCPGRPHADCPITSVTLLRYGLLGPGARRVRLAGAAGSHTLRTSAGIGGAYLFAVALPVAPYVAANAALRGSFDEYRRASKAATARGLSAREATREAMRVAGRDSTYVRPPKVSVLATFGGGGRTLRVAGAGRTHAALPGLGTRAATRQQPLPRSVPVRVNVRKPGRFATVQLSFRAPRAITRFDVHYSSTLSGPAGRTCEPESGGSNATTGDIAAGQAVRIVMRRRGVRSNGRRGWCPGRFTGTVRYSTPGANIVIGRYAFRIP
jgi:hypothetical protein